MPEKSISLSNLQKFKQELDDTYGQANQPAKLDNTGKVPQAQLPADVYNVLEYNAFNAFPATGEEKKLYIDKATNNMYRWDTNQYVSVSAPESVKYIEQTLTAQQREQTRENVAAVSYEAPTSQQKALTEAQKAQARTNIGAASPSDIPTGVVRYDTAQSEITEAQKTIARTNIGAASPSDIPTGVVRYDTEQSMTTEQKATARANIGAASPSDIPTGVVRYDTDQSSSITTPQKTAARANIGAASASDVSTLSGTVADINSRLNNFGDFVRNVEEGESGLDITYDSGLVENVQTGLIFNGGYVDENNYLYLKYGETILSRDIFEPVKLPEGGGGGSSITLTNVTVTRTVRNGDHAPFSFVATTSDSMGLSVKWYVNDVLYSTQNGDSGDSFSFDAQEYLTPSDVSRVKAFIESVGGASLTPTWTVTSVAFAVSWGSSISPIMLYTTDDNIYVPINASAEARTNNVINVTVGNSAPITRNVTGSQTVTIELNKNLFTPGKNVVSAYMASAEDPTDRTPVIHFTVIWGYGLTTPVVTFADSAITCSQYDTVNIDYFVFDPDNEQANCTITVGSEEPISMTADRRTQTYQYVADVSFTGQQTQKTVNITLACQSVSTTIPVTVQKVNYNLSYWDDASLVYDLNPVGHSNTDANRELFGNLSFYNFDWDNGGFKDDASGARAFVVKKGSRVTLPRGLFQDADANGKTIDISFMNTNCDQYDAIAMQELDGSAAKGILLRANNGEVRLNSTTGQDFRYSEESRVDMSIHVEAYDANDLQRVTTVWMDGIPSRVNAYSAGTLVQTDNNLVIGSDHCDVWIYCIRVYISALTKQNMMQNYVSCGPTTKDKIKRYETNMILDSNDRFTPEDLLSVAPNLTIVHLYTPRMTVSKEDPVPARITIQDGGTVLELPAATGPDTGDGTVFKVQGTSSAAYGRSSYNLDLDFKGTGKKYKISETSIPVNYINIKVNVASSENANNVNAVDWYNTYQPYLTEARKADERVRDTIEGKPCAVFITNTANEAVWFSSQLVPAGATVLYAMGDICNSKKNKAVFGQDGSGEHPTKACIEVSGNDTEPERFRSTEAVYSDSKGAWQTDGPWDEQKQQYTKIKHYEWRMEPDGEYSDTTSTKYEVVTAWNNLVSWLVSTINDSAKFKREIGQYFALDSLLYHFLFIEYFAAYDNVSKNTFYSYDWDEDAERYLWNIKCAYDMDTILACDNDGIPYGDYGLDYGDLDGTRSYFNAVTNTIWVNLKKEFQPELSNMYIALRSRGAWDAITMLNKWDTYQNKRPRVAMMVDAYTKYILPYKTNNVILDGQTYSYDNSYLPRMQGSKTYWRKQFLTYQTSYMDGKYGSASKSSAIAFRTNCASDTRDYAIKSYAKTYMTVIVDDNKVGSQKVNPGEEVVFENVSVGTNTTLYVAPDKLVQYVRPLNNTQNSTFVASGASKLTEAMLGGEDINTSWPSTSSVTIPSVVLKDLSIQNMPNFTSALDLSANVEIETIDTRNTSAGAITLPTSAPIATARLNACTSIKANSLNKVNVFTMEGGQNLISIHVENCNDIVNTAIATYLQQATAAQSQATRRIRVVMDTTPNEYELNKSYFVGDVCMHDGNRYRCAVNIPVSGEWDLSYWQADPDATKINWQFINLDTLYNVARSWKGYNALGEIQDKPIVAGHVHVAALSKKKLETIHAVWGTGSMDDSLDEDDHIYTATNLIITYDDIIPYYAVTFKNIDSSPIKDKQGNNYIQYVDSNNEAYDPIVAGEVNIPTYIDPTGEYRYTFDSWTNLSGAVHEPKDVVAAYTREVITYTVRWLDKPNGTVYDIRTGVPYGSEAVYDPNGTIGFPVDESLEPTNTYKLFAGWDKSTGYIRGDLDVYATWVTGQLPSVGTHMKDMNVAQIYGVTKVDQDRASRASTYFDDETGDDYIDIQVGKDFTFSGTTSEEILTNRYFDGTEMLKRTDIKLFDENADNFTLAIDYEFTQADNNATIACCCDNITGDEEGFRLYYNAVNNSVNIRWGDQTDVIGYGLNRGIVVIRHRKGSKNLYVASNYGGRPYTLSSWGYGLDETNTQSDEVRYGAYYADMHAREVPRAQYTSTNGCLAFGAIPIGDYGKSSSAKGWVHWCKIWNDDLGINVIKEIANWPRETWRMQYRGLNIYSRADSTGFSDGASFIANAPLSQVYEIYTLGQVDTTGGWTNSPLRTFINNRCFKALPYPWQKIVKTMRVRTKGGADAPAAWQLTEDRMYIPSVIDMTANATDYSTEGQTVKWFTTNYDRPKYLGIVVPPDANVITDTDSDPTLLTETYTIKEGDVWYPTGQSGEHVRSYVYISAQTAAKHKIIGGREVVNINNIAAAGAQGGYWIGSFTYTTRSNPATTSTNKNQQFTVYPQGSVTRNTYIDYDSNKYRGILLMFSI